MLDVSHRHLALLTLLSNWGTIKCTCTSFLAQVYTSTWAIDENVKNVKGWIMHTGWHPQVSVLMPVVLCVVILLHIIGFVGLSLNHKTCHCDQKND